MNKKFLGIAVALAYIASSGGSLAAGTGLNSTVKPIAAHAAEGMEETEFGPLTYVVYEDHIEITNCDKSAEVVEIPAEIDGVPVTVIGDHAFEYCEALNDVMIPDGIQTIGAFAFANCPALKVITLPKSVETVGERAFEGDTSLESVTVPNPDCEFGAYAISWGKGTCIYCYPTAKVTDFARKFGISYIELDDSYMIEYEIYDDHAEVTHCDTAAVAVMIPEEIDGVPVTSINWNAFEGCSELRSVYIPDTVHSIFSCAFMGCSSLEMISIPTSVSYIDNWAFNNCSSLKAVYMPENVEFFGEGVFCGCESLEAIYSRSETGKAITLPKGVYEVGQYTFCNTSLKEIYIPDGVTSVANDAFGSSREIKFISFPESVQKIGENAVGGSCPALEAVIFENPDCEIFDSADTIVENAVIYGYEGSTAQAYAERYNREFADIAREDIFRFHDVNDDSSIDRCTNDYAVNVTVPAEHNGVPVKYISTSAFSGIKTLKNVVLPDTIEYINSTAFFRCTSLKSINFPEGLKEIGHDAFAECPSLESVELPASLELIEDFAFYKAYSLESVVIRNPECDIYNRSTTFPENAVIYGYAGSTAQKYAERFDREFIDLNTYNNPDSLKFEVYDDHAELTYCERDAVSVIVPEEVDGKPVTSIEPSAFQGCTALKTVVLPDSIETIGSYAFRACESLKEINLPANLKTIEYGAFVYCKSLESITIPDKVETISDSAFLSCFSLKSVDFPESVKSIGADAFNSCNSLEFVIIENPKCELGDPNANTPDENKYVLPEHTIIYGYAGSTAQSYAEELHREFREINDALYLNYDNCGDHIEITGLKEPRETLDIPAMIEGLPVTQINKDAFMGCDFLRSVTLPDTLGHIFGSAFQNCSSLESIEIPDNVYSLDCWAFCNCTSLRSVKLPQRLDWFDEGVFCGCNALESIELPEGITTIGSYMFCGTNIKTIKIPDSVEEIGNNAFLWCTSLESIELPENLRIIGGNAFSHCMSLKNITIPASVEAVWEEAFMDCTSLESIVFENPSCYIHDDDENYEDAIPQSTVICGYRGSNAREYARAHGNKYIPIDGEYEPVSWIVSDSVASPGAMGCIDIIISNTDENPVEVSCATFKIMANDVINIGKFVDIDNIIINEKYADNVDITSKNGIFRFETKDGSAFEAEDGLVLATVYYTAPENCPLGDFNISLVDLRAYDSDGHDVSDQISSEMGCLNVVPAEFEGIDFYFADMSAVVSNGRNRVAFKFNRNVPEEYTIVENGVLYTKAEDPNGDDFNIDTENPVIKRAKNGSNINSSSWTVSIANMESTGVFVRGYMIVENDRGQQKVIYTDIVYGSYGDIMFGNMLEKIDFSVSKDAVVTGGKKRVSFKFDRNIPEGLTLVENGILYTKNEPPLDEDFTQENEALSKVPNTSNANVSSWTVNIADMNNTGVTVRGYIIVEDADGRSMTLFTDIVYGNYEDIMYDRIDEFASLNISEPGAVVTNNKRRVSFTFERNVPDIYTLVENGIIYTKAEGIPNYEFNIDTENPDVKKVKNTATANASSWTVNIADMEDTGVTARGYMIVRDAEGREIVKYTDIVYGNYCDIVTSSINASVLFEVNEPAAVVTSGKKRVSFTFNRNVPEKYNIVENGILYTKAENYNEDDFTLESETVSRYKNPANTNISSWTVNIADMEDTGVSARGYMIVEDAAGVQNVMYTKVVYNSHEQIKLNEMRESVSFKANSPKPVVSSGKNRVSFTFSRSVPEKYTVVENGILYLKEYNKNTEDFALDGGRATKYANPSNANTSSWTVNIADMDNTGVSACGYMIVKDSDGRELVVYTDIFYGNFAELSK